MMVILKQGMQGQLKILSSYAQRATGIRERLVDWRLFKRRAQRGNPNAACPTTRSDADLGEAPHALEAPEIVGRFEHPRRQTWTIVIFAILAAIAIGAIVGFTTFSQIAGLKTEMARLKHELVATKNTLSQLEKRVADSAAVEGHAQAPPDRDRTLGMVPAQDRASTALLPEHTRLIRDYIKVPPSAPGTPPTIQVGDVLPDAELMPLPSTIGEKVPRLRGARFTTDRNGSIVIVGRGSKLVDLIVPPN